MNIHRIKPQGELTEDKAWLLGFAAGDGHVHHDMAAGTYSLTLTAGLEKDKDLAYEGQRILISEYGVPVSCRRTERSRADRLGATPAQTEKGRRASIRQPYWSAFAYSKELVEDLLRIAPFGIHRWKVPEAVLSGPEAIRGAWLAGFADAEGCAQHAPEVSRRTFTFSSVNPSLNVVADMLRGFGIDPSVVWYPRDSTEWSDAQWSDEGKIILCHKAALERFAEVVPLRCGRKVATIAAALASYQRDVLRKKEVDLLAPRVQDMLEQKLTYDEIAEKLEITPDQVRQTVRGRDLDGPGRGRGRMYQRSEKLWPEIKARLDAGEYRSDVAEDLGLSDDTLDNICRGRDYKTGRARGLCSRRSEEYHRLIPRILEVLNLMGNPEVVGLLNTENPGLNMKAQQLANFLVVNGIKRDPEASKRIIREKQEAARRRKSENKE